MPSIMLGYECIYLWVCVFEWLSEQTTAETIDLQHNNISCTSSFDSFDCLLGVTVLVLSYFYVTTFLHNLFVRKL